MEERRFKTITRNMVMTKTQMGDYAFMSPNCLKLQKKGKRNIHKGGSRIFVRRRFTRLLLYFNTNKPHSFFFCRIPVVLENRRSSRGEGGGAHPLHLPPRSAPDLVKLRCIRIPALHTLRFFSPIGFRLFKVGTEFLHPFQYTLHLHKLNNSTKKT